MIMKQLIEKFNDGDHLSTQDCKKLLKFFSNMECGCLELGMEYNLFRHEMRRNKTTVEGYINARKWY